MKKSFLWGFLPLLLGCFFVGCTKRLSCPDWVSRILTLREPIGSEEISRLPEIEIKDVKKMHHALAEKGWGKDITLTIIREGEKKEITVTLPSSKD